MERKGNVCINGAACAQPVKGNEKVTCEGITLPNCEVMKKVEKEGNTCLGIVELDKINEDEMKEITIKEYKASIGLKIKAKWEKQNNSNKCMGSGCIQI